MAIDNGSFTFQYASFDAQTTNTISDFKVISQIDVPILLY